MKIFRVLAPREWLVSHAFIVGGLALISVGLLYKVTVSLVGGIWALSGGFCLVAWFVLRKLVKAK